MNQRILCIGEALIDMICTDRDTPLSEGEHFLKKPGGAPTNVAAAIAALGGQVSLAAKVGNDPFGRQLEEVMQSFGVDTRWMLRDTDRFTTLAFVSLMANGERDFVFSRGADGNLSMADLQGLPTDSYGIVHFGSATGFLPGPLQETYLHLLHEARAKGLFVSFDPNYRSLLFPNDTDSFVQQSRYFLEQCDFFKVGDEEALLLTGATTLENAVIQLQDFSDAVFAVTIGSKGTLLRVGDTVSTVPSIAIEPVDTTGAGDAFVGALLFQLAQQQPEANARMSYDAWAHIVSNANKAGARTCEYLGAMEAFRHLNTQIFS